MKIPRWIHLEMENIWDNFCREIRYKIYDQIFFFRKSWRLWHNVEKYGTARQVTADNIIRHMRVACWITKATQTHTHTYLEYVIFIAFPLQQ